MKKYPQMKQISQTSRAQKLHAIWYVHDFMFVKRLSLLCSKNEARNSRINLFPFQIEWDVTDMDDTWYDTINTFNPFQCDVTPLEVRDPLTVVVSQFYSAFLMRIVLSYSQL